MELRKSIGNESLFVQTRNRDKEGLWYPVGGGSLGTLSASMLSFLSVLNPQGTRCGPRKGIMFWMERLIITLVSRRGGTKRGASWTEDTEVAGEEWQDLGEARGLEGESGRWLFPRSLKAGGAVGGVPCTPRCIPSAQLACEG